MTDLSTGVQIERLAGKVERLERDATSRDSRASKILAELESTRRAVESLRAQIDQQAAMAVTAKAAADKALADLATRREDEEAEARLRKKIALYAQYVIGILILVISMWSGGVKSTLDWAAQWIKDIK